MTVKATLYLFLFIHFVLICQPAQAKSGVDGYIDHVRDRIEESWRTYDINGITASVRLSINAGGEITATKLLRSTGAQTDALKTEEAIRYATPFGKPPSGKKALNLTVLFQQNRVSISNSATAGRVTTRAQSQKKAIPAKAAGKMKVQVRYPAHPASVSHKSAKRYNTTQSAKELLDYLKY